MQSRSWACFGRLMWTLGRVRPCLILPTAGYQPADVLPWRTKFGGMDPKMAKQLQELQKENSRLKKLVADQALDMLILKEAARPN